MRKKVLKAILAIILFIILISTIIFISTNDGSAKNDGYITIIINNKDNQIVSQERIGFKKGDSLFDIIDENYDLTCDNSAYGHYVIGVSGDDFKIMTEGNADSWIWFETAYLKDGIEYSNNIDFNDYNTSEVNKGIDNIELIDNMIFAINERNIDNPFNSVFNHNIRIENDNNIRDILSIILVIIIIILIILIILWLIFKKKETKITTKQLCILAFMTAILFVQEQLLSFIPNVQFTFMLIALYTVIFGVGNTVLIVCAHVLLDNLIMGSLNPIVMIPMLVGYLILILLVYLVRNKNLVWITISASIGSVLYCLCFLVINSVCLDIDIWAYYIADIPFEILLVTSTIITIMYAYRPVEKIIRSSWDN